MEIFKLVWQKIDWNAYYVVGYNYIIDHGIIYGVTEDIVLQNCPITKEQGKIYIEKIQVLK
jgi:hypothetical protein